MICDFCTEPDPAWEYPAREVLLPDGTLSFGPWCACDVCRELVDANDRGALAVRAYRAHPEVRLEVYRATQGMFFTACTGPARPVEVTPMHGRFFDR